MSLRATHRRGDEPEIEGGPWLELRGQISEAVRGITEIRLNLYPTESVEVGTARPASIGSILRLRPELDVVIAWPTREFGHLWDLALTGHLRCGRLVFTEPYRNKSLVVSASFSNEAEE